MSKLIFLGIKRLHRRLCIGHGLINLLGQKLSLCGNKREMNKEDKCTLCLENTEIDDARAPMRTYRASQSRRRPAVQPDRWVSYKLATTSIPSVSLEKRVKRRQRPVRNLRATTATRSRSRMEVTGGLTSIFALTPAVGTGCPRDLLEKRFFGTPGNSKRGWLGVHQDAIDW